MEIIPSSSRTTIAQLPRIAIVSFQVNLGVRSSLFLLFCNLPSNFLINLSLTHLHLSCIVSLVLYSKCLQFFCLYHLSSLSFLLSLIILSQYSILTSLLCPKGTQYFRFFTFLCIMKSSLQGIYYGFLLNLIKNWNIFYLPLLL